MLTLDEFTVFHVLVTMRDCPERQAPGSCSLPFQASRYERFCIIRFFLSVYLSFAALYSECRLEPSFQRKQIPLPPPLLPSTPSHPSSEWFLAVTLEQSSIGARSFGSVFKSQGCHSPRTSPWPSTQFFLRSVSTSTNGRKPTPSGLLSRLNEYMHEALRTGPVASEDLINGGV